LEEVGTTKGDVWLGIKGSKPFWESSNSEISLEFPHKGYPMETNPSSEAYSSGIDDMLDQEGVKNNK